MPNDECLHSAASGEAVVAANRENILELMRLLAKETARRLPRNSRDTAGASSPTAKQHTTSQSIISRSG